MIKNLMTMVGACLLAAVMITPASAQRSTDTIGYCISDGFYGNEPNIVGPFAPGGPSAQEPGTKGGRVVPSQSPGPFVNNPNDPDNPTRGNSLGFYHDLINAGVLPDLCG